MSHGRCCAGGGARGKKRRTGVSCGEGWGYLSALFIFNSRIKEPAATCMPRLWIFSLSNDGRIDGLYCHVI
jgi:hypothetical protein